MEMILKLFVLGVLVCVLLYNMFTPNNSNEEDEGELYFDQNEMIRFANWTHQYDDREFDERSLEIYLVELYGIDYKERFKIK